MGATNLFGGSIVQELAKAAFRAKYESWKGTAGGVRG
jgi:hypothetical protein